MMTTDEALKAWAAERPAEAVAQIQRLRACLYAIRDGKLDADQCRVLAAHGLVGGTPDNAVDHGIDLAPKATAEAATARAAPTADVVYVLDVADNDYGAQGKPIAVYSTRAAAEAYLRLPRRGYAGVMEVPFNPPVPPR